MIVTKRDGRKEEFDIIKIGIAITKAAGDINIQLDGGQMGSILHIIEEKVGSNDIAIEKLHDTIESALYIAGQRKVREAYSSYRKERDGVRDFKSNLMTVIDRIGVATDRDNANVGNNFSAKLLRIASEANKWHNLAMMPKDMAKEHECGNIYYHDLDSENLTVNCLHIPTGRIFREGFNTGYGHIRTPKRIESAAELTCILLQASQNDMFGGQAHPNFDNDMAYFVGTTRAEMKKEVFAMFEKSIGIAYVMNHSEEIMANIVEPKVEKSTRQAMQSICYNLNSMHSRAGSQVPFSSINLGIPESEDAALVCKLFLEEYNKGMGKGEQFIFPNIIFRVKKGVNFETSDPYYYLFQIACDVASKRMNPTFMNIDADFNKEWYDKGIMPATMGCRTYVMSNINGEPGTEGRGNISPTTMNLPRMGIEAAKFSKEHEGADTIETLFDILDERLHLSRKSLLYRYDVLKQLKVKDLPFVAGQGLMKGSEGLSDNDSIEPILKQGTWGIGFIGLAETLVALTGKHHGESAEAQALGCEIVQYIRNFCDKYKEIDKLNWSCYATPAEGLSSKFTDIDKKVFGEIPGVTDKDYYTNSYHVPVGYPISIKAKTSIEAPYHKLCNAGHITYFEFDYYPTGAIVENTLRYAYSNSNISYIGINFHLRYCKECGSRIEPASMECPHCKSWNIQGISRVTGYLSLDERFGKGKEAERSDRISHENGSKIYKL
jgi:ribonucleoside-triphosphate reductase